MTYDPSEPGKKGTIFGLPYTKEEADLVFLPVHLDATVSYGEGTAHAPELILSGSTQLDLSLPGVHRPWELKMAMMDGVVDRSENKLFREKAKKVIYQLEEGEGFSPDLDKLVHEVNVFCRQTHLDIEKRCDELLRAGKYVGITGGDHSAPLGLIRALSKTTEFGILQVDAHMDLRRAYEGFSYSHASIMFNALKERSVTSITQVGIRDFCEEEEEFIKNTQKPVKVFYDEEIFHEKLEGVSWKEITANIVSSLPDQVYISLDVDGLDPSLCPATGTPVPGGLSFNETVYLIEEVVRSGRKLIGFDLCETGNATWDANVSSRILFRLSMALGISQGLIGNCI